MINETILAIIIAFAISAMLCPIVIPFLHRLKFGQEVRKEGPESHLKKQGTPTMGGLIILTSIIITSLFFVKDYPKIIPVLFVTVGFGIVGFLDDYIKIVMKRSEGLTPVQKMAGQLIITGIFAFYLLHSKDVGTEMLVPFTGGFEKGLYLNLGILFVPAVFFIVIGTDNGVNFTDGLDGLCGGVSVITFGTFGMIAIAQQQVGIALFCFAVVGALFGFLVFNLNPAKVFMGDTGSLALGAAIAAVSILLKQELLLVIVGLVYVIETLSVIIQVAYYKRTQKRIFKMAPIHHHFELCGWSEWKVVTFLWAIALICGVIGLLIAI